MQINSNSHRFFISIFLRISHSDIDGNAILRSREEGFMTVLDFVLPATGLGFFVLGVAYAYACDRL
jgi:hypothetical protein